MRILPYVTLLTVSVASGILVSSQWQVRTTRVVNPVQPYTSLTDTRDALTEEQKKLKDEIAKTSASVEQRKSAIGSAKDVDQTTVDSTAESAMAAGFTKVVGPGVIATLNDSPNGNLSEQAIAHAADLRDMISLMRAMGAEAISINGERVITTTAIDCIVNTILVNDTRLSNPFIVTAIGDSETMARALNDPSILSDLHKRVVQDGIVFTVETKSRVEIPAYAGKLPGTHATLVP